MAFCQFVISADWLESFCEKIDTERCSLLIGKPPIKFPSHLIERLHACPPTYADKIVIVEPSYNFAQDIIKLRVDICRKFAEFGAKVDIYLLDLDGDQIEQCFESLLLHPFWVKACWRYYGTQWPRGPIARSFYEIGPTKLMQTS